MIEIPATVLVPRCDGAWSKTDSHVYVGESGRLETASGFPLIFYDETDESSYWKTESGIITYMVAK